jgi:hypothetical protein
MDHTPQQLRAGVGSVLAAIQRFAHAACQRVTGAPPAGTNASTNTSSVAVKSDGYAAGPGTAHTPEIDPLLSCLGTSAVKEMQIPFPDFISIPERFTSTAVDGKTFSVTYRPRQKLMDFKLHMDSRILRNTGSIVNVRGFIGAGKSHILLAYAVYMMGLRTLGFNVPRVIYLSNCSRAAANIVQSIKMAFALAYYDDIDDIEAFTDVQHAKNFIDVKLDQGDMAPVFIFEDWNYFPDASEDRVRIVKENLMAFARCVTVCGVSANEHTLKMSGSESTMANEFILNGLTEAEWDIWKSSPSLAALVKSMDSKEKQDTVVHMTGLIPLLLADLTRLVVSKNCDLIAALDDLVNKSRDILHGCWVRVKLRAFYMKFADAPDDRDDHVTLMIGTLGRVSGLIVTASLYDHRFFYLDAAQTRLLPSCGIVEVELARLLGSLQGSRILAKFNKSWASIVMRTNINNSSVQGFAFELYALTELRLRFFAHMNSLALIPQMFGAKSFPSIEVVEFSGDFPDPTVLNDSGCTCFLPTKWNLRHIDCAFRWVFTTKLTVDTDQQIEEHQDAAVCDQKEQPHAGQQSAHEENVPDVCLGSSEELNLRRSSRKGAGALDSKPTGKRAAHGDSQVQKVRTVETTVVFLYFVQVTLDAPIDHAKSLEVFTTKYMCRTTEGPLAVPQTDCSRYIKSSDGVVRRTMLWVLPSTAKSRRLPANVSGETQVVLVLPVVLN